MHAPIKHIWFDFAGTLYKETVDFQQAHSNFKYQTYTNLTGKTDMQEVKDEYGKLLQEHGSNSAVFRVLGKPSDFWQKAVDGFNRQAFLLPDVHVSQTLNTLRQHVPLSIFTNFMFSKIEELLAYLEIPKEYFTNILSGDTVKERKPALDGFYLMIEKSGLPPENLIYIGDREAVDIVPAKHVGMQTCLLYGNGVKTVADYSFDSFSDLLSLV